MGRRGVVAAAISGGRQGVRGKGSGGPTPVSSRGVPVSDHERLVSLLRDLAAGRRRVVRSGRVVPYRLDGDDRERFERAKRVGYVVVGRRRPHAGNCYRAWCSLHRGRW